MSCSTTKIVKGESDTGNANLERGWGLTDSEAEPDSSPQTTND